VRGAGNMAQGEERSVALVTGARRGLGRAIAYSLASAGFDLVLNDLVEDDQMIETIEGTRQRGAHVQFLHHDIADIERHEDFAMRVFDGFGRLDCLVNNAGIQVPRRVSVMEIGAAEFDDVLNVNLRGTFFLTQAIARLMIERKRGSHNRAIITITSSNAVLASTDKAAYCLSKSALSMMNALYALELGCHDIQVFEIRPGLMATDMTASVRDKYADYVRDNTLFNRWGEPGDVGRTVATLATGGLAYASGQVIDIDGGIHIRRL